MKRRVFLGVLGSLPWVLQGWGSADPLSRLDADFRRGLYPGVDGMVVLRGKETLYSATYPVSRPTLQGEPGIYNYSDPDWHPVRNGLHTLQSVTKSVLSALVGIALSRGQLESVQQQVYPGVSLQDLLTMQAGWVWDEDKDWPALERSPDWLAYVLAKEREPKRFNYSSGVPIALASVLEAATGSSIEDYAREQLFLPLGIHEFSWKKTPTGLADTQGGLYLSTAGLARFGAYYLRKDPWVVESFQPRVADEDWRYGYGWWLLPHPGLPGEWVPTALGYGGQRIFLLPRQNLVAAFTGWNPGGQGALPYEKVLQILLECA